MNTYMEHFQKTTREQWKNAAKYQEEFKDTKWTEARSMLLTLVDFISKMSIFGEFMSPFMDMLEVFDAAIVKEYKDEIVALNKAMQSTYPYICNAAAAIHEFTDAIKDLKKSSDEWEENDPWGQDPDNPWTHGPARRSDAEDWWTVGPARGGGFDDDPDTWWW